MLPETFVYPLIDTAVCAERSVDPLAVADACLRGGARLVQLRAKEDSTAALLALADRLVAAGRATGALVVINDRADVAAMSVAGGVHVGQEDLPVAAARAIVGADLIVGVSTHTRDQIDRALDSSASYIAVGPIYETGTKATGYSARGLDLIGYAAGRGKPVVAIGGITLERATEVLGAGASGLAVITDLLVGGDPGARTRAFVKTIRTLNPEP